MSLLTLASCRLQEALEVLLGACYLSVISVTVSLVLRMFFVELEGGISRKVSPLVCSNPFFCALFNFGVHGLAWLGYFLETTKICQASFAQIF